MNETQNNRLAQPRHRGKPEGRKRPQNGNRVPRFDRELREAIANGTQIRLDLATGSYAAGKMLWVDPYFVKMRVEEDGLGVEMWFNKSHILSCMIVA